jgi:hypothetical protein
MNTARVAAIMILCALLGAGCQKKSPKEVERPEKIVSLRQVMYDSSTYAKLAQLWEKYYEVYPSEDAYANWMYAAFYAEFPNFGSMLNKGVEKYPSNPVLLYLAGREKSPIHGNLEGRQLLERAASLDPSYMEPWHSLVIEYLAEGDRENVDVALRRLLNGGAVEDEIMDFSYNMFASMDTNAILITNGDNDTFPGWILTRIIRFRPDVNIVNRSLLNTDWYPREIVKEGVPAFITQAELETLKVQVAADIEKVKSSTIPWQDFALLGDRLIVRLIESAQRSGRPVYFACTVESSKLLKPFMTQGRRLGLLTLVTPSPTSYPMQLRKLFTTWTSEFRTGGLDSWQLRSASEARAGRVLVKNYAAALHSLKDQIEAAGPDVQLSLFRWYRKHLVDLISKGYVDDVNKMWCGPGRPREIQEWCKAQGLAK